MEDCYYKSDYAYFYSCVYSVYIELNASLSNLQYWPMRETLALILVDNIYSHTLKTRCLYIVSPYRVAAVRCLIHFSIATEDTLSKILVSIS